MIGVGKAKQYANVLDRPIGKGKQEVILFLTGHHRKAYKFDLFLEIEIKVIDHSGS